MGLHTNTRGSNTLFAGGRLIFRTQKRWQLKVGFLQDTYMRLGRHVLDIEQCGTGSHFVYYYMSIESEINNS